MMKAFVVKFFRIMKIMTVIISKKSQLIPVPAAAVIQEEQALFVFIESKGCVVGF